MQYKNYYIAIEETTHNILEINAHGKSTGVIVTADWWDVEHKYFVFAHSDCEAMQYVDGPFTTVEDAKACVDKLDNACKDCKHIDFSDNLTGSKCNSCGLEVAVTA